ncbi:MAG: class I SAM-dependent methyltransferase [Alphaproteobacteria bacterium]|nr:class I SAM-dependent methyltransferase [Alphaproteobacteria bacterium]
MNCRHCCAPLSDVFLDLGNAPPSNAYLTAETLRMPEMTFPLKLFVCSQCRLVQTEDYADADMLFQSDYAYFSSTSKSWLSHAAEYCTMISQRLGLSKDSFVIEIASNDGYLLKNFVTDGTPCVGIEPTGDTATFAESLGVPVIREFFGEALGRKLADEGQQADLVIGNNVYAHVPDINDFTKGITAVLKPEGICTLEFPHLMRLVEFSQFDTVYHEHYSYLSLIAVSKIFTAAGLRVFDVEEISTHGGSLRVYGCREGATIATLPNVARVMSAECERGMETDEFYRSFQQSADRVKNDLLGFLLEQKKLGKTVSAYGAAAKGNTLLNYAGVKPDLLGVVYDAAKAKQHKFMPASHIPIRPPSELPASRPDYIVVLPWNIFAEVEQQLAPLHALGTRFVTAVPELTIR